MNLRRCLLLLLLVCVCLSGLFSPGLTAHAADPGEDDIYLEQHEMPSFYNITDEDYSNSNLLVSQVLAINGNFYTFINWKPFISGGTLTPDYYYTSNLQNWTSGIVMQNNLNFKLADNTKMLSKDSKVSFVVTDIYHEMDIDVASVELEFDPSLINNFKVQMRDINGAYINVTDFTYKVTTDGEHIDIYVDIAKMPSDAYQMNIVYTYSPTAWIGIERYLGTNTTINLLGGYEQSRIEFDESKYDETSGLISSIIQWVKSIYEGIVNLPNKIRDSLDALFGIIKNAIVDLGNTLLDGIKSLFIPDEEYITQFYDDMNDMLSARLGALFQVGDIVSDFASSLRDYDSESSISVPELTVNLAGSEFTIGGWEVDLLPQGFGILLDALKLVTDIGVTCMFINIMRKKYDKLVEG